MRKVLAVCFLVALSIVTKAEEKKVYNGFSGGMMLHAGYLFGIDSRNPNSMQGATYGLGGALRVHLWEHLRIGGEGYVSNMPSTISDQHSILCQGSYLRTGWGGLLADAFWKKEKVWPYVGATVGGGASRGLYIVDGSQYDFAPEQVAMLHKQSFGFVCPYVGFDYLLTKAAHLTFKLDWMLAFSSDGLAMPTGPRLYFGFMFSH